MKLVLATAMAFFASAALAQGPSDPQIAGIVVTANQIDVDQGKLAQARSKNKEVQDFAKRMVTDHTAVNKQASDLVTKLKGAEFDKAYVNHEVDYHQQVLDAIDKVLIPNSKNAELKDLITKVRPAIAAHLDHAKMVQSSLKK